MAHDGDIFVEAARLTREGTPFVLATVISAKGSTPRNAGAKMLWRPDADVAGTIGGGQFEMLVADSARRVFDARSTRMEHYILGAEAEQCCGGAMDVFLEYCGARQDLYIFGAGHVAYELVDVLRGSPLAITIVDDRTDWNSAERFASPTRSIMDWDEGVHQARQRPERTLVCVMTCSHDTDLQLLERLLAPAGAPRYAGSIPAFVGLIGSRSKRVCLFGKLISSGIDEEVVQRVQCPIGVGDTGKEPRMVAVSMAAGLLLEAKKLDVPAAASPVTRPVGMVARSSAQVG